MSAHIATPVLQVDQVTARLPGRTLIKELSLTLNAGEIVSLIGPNGAGKTSLLRLISGDLTTTAGTVVLNGRALADWPLRERARTLAVLTQANPLVFDFTAAEVVALGRSPHSTGAALDWQLCRDAMTALDVLHLAQRTYPSLSGGEQQRVQLARVMAQIWRAESDQPRLLLLDEPVAALDLGHQQQLMQAVRCFAGSGVAVIMALHDIGLAAAWSDRLLALKNGQLAAAGPPQDVVTEARIGELFDTRVRIVPHPDTGKPVVMGG